MSLRSAAAISGMLLLCACHADQVSLGAWLPPSAHTRDAGHDDSLDAGLADTGLGVDIDASALPTQTDYLEAESGELSMGFSVGKDPAASNEQYLAPPAGSVPLDDIPGPARARYTLNIRRAGNYRIWGRIYAPTASNNRFWFRVDDGAWYKWRITVGEIWYWDAFHDNTKYGKPLDFALTQGAHELAIANCVEDVRLDRLYVTADGDVPPGNDTPCHPPNSIDIGGTCFPSCGSQRGDTCGPQACQGFAILSAYDCDVCCRTAP